MTEVSFDPVTTPPPSPLKIVMATPPCSPSKLTSPFSVKRSLLINDALAITNTDDAGIDIDIGSDIDATSVPVDMPEMAMPERASPLSRLRGRGTAVLSRILVPPTIAVLFGCLVGLFPPFKSLFFPDEDDEDDTAPLQFFVDSTEMLGRIAIPCSMMVLGANLSRGPTSETLSARTIVSVCVARLIVVPAIVTALIFLSVHIGLLPFDPVLLFVLLLEAATPSAMSLVIICQMNGGGEKDMSSLQFWVYLSTAVTLTCWVTVYIFLLF
eukprot:TRINITY_DN4554_c0_g1_i1.p1 TRINITY_DN4554_c0_g1~~TRINITY_DN4554_c0_g1_i1.p1  ORF type:complete len:308 (-),score=95.59 TRINITY_DN4554_c0_g1_i1:90-896(-)